MQEMPVLQGFRGYLRKRFTLAFGEPITIAATGRTDRNVAAADRRYRSRVGRAGWVERNVWGSGKITGQGATCLERGRRRTRQDQISQAIGQLDRWTQEIANRCWDSHRTKKTCFFCRTGLWRERTPSNNDPAV